MFEQENYDHRLIWVALEPTSAPIGRHPMTPGNRSIKDDLRALAEIVIVAFIGAGIGGLTGWGIIVGVVAAVALCWLALGLACLHEFWHGK